jgi:hypothetical protein
MTTFSFNRDEFRCLTRPRNRFQIIWKPRESIIYYLWFSTVGSAQLRLGVTSYVASYLVRAPEGELITRPAQQAAVRKADNCVILADARRWPPSQCVGTMSSNATAAAAIHCRRI